MAADAKEDKDELIELLNELRVTLPGVQVLFAFLLAVPFTNRFTKISGAQTDAYFISLLATLMGSVLLIAPSAYHRIRWREVSDEVLLRVSNRLATAGTVFLAIAMSASVYLVTDLVYKSTVTSLVTAGTAAAFGWFWYGLPLVHRRRGL